MITPLFRWVIDECSVIPLFRWMTDEACVTPLFRWVTDDDDDDDDDEARWSVFSVYFSQSWHPLKIAVLGVSTLTDHRQGVDEVSFPYSGEWLMMKVLLPYSGE